MTNEARLGAEERLLDAALAQVFASPRPAVVPARTTLWWAAVGGLALLVLGGVKLLHGQRAAVLLQDPQPVVAPEPELPPACLARGAEEIAVLPANVQNLIVEQVRPAELGLLQAFRDLRRLELRWEPPPEGGAGPRGPRFWRQPKPELLAPLAALPELSELQLPRDMAVAPSHVEALAKAPHLRLLVLPGAAVLDASMAAALRGLPRLTGVRLEMAHVTVSFLAGLQGLLRLECIACTGLDDDAVAAIGRQTSIQHLALTHQNGGSRAKGPLSVAAFRTLATMPALRSLDLEESEVGEEQLQLLPVPLQRLSLGSRHVDFAVASALGRLVNLQDLTVGAGNDPKAGERLAKVLGTLPLHRLAYRGNATAKLLSAAAALPNLRELEIQAFSALDLQPLAAAKELSALTVLATYRHRPLVAELAPLAKSKTLRRLHLVGVEGTPEEVAAVVGSTVEITMTPGL